MNQSSNVSQERWQDVVKKRAHNPERDDDGNVVVPLSQLADPYIADTVTAADWAGRVDFNPWTVSEMQRNEIEQIDHLFSNLNDNQN